MEKEKQIHSQEGDQTNPVGTQNVGQTLTHTSPRTTPEGNYILTPDQSHALVVVVPGKALSPQPNLVASFPSLTRLQPQTTLEPPIPSTPYDLPRSSTHQMPAYVVEIQDTPRKEPCGVSVPRRLKGKGVILKEESGESTISRGESEVTREINFQANNAMEGGNHVEAGVVQQELIQALIQEGIQRKMERHLSQLVSRMQL